MNFYQDITLKPNDEINLFLLRNKVYDRLHKALYDLKTQAIGLSFPNLICTKQEDISDNKESIDYKIEKEEFPKLGITTYKLGSTIRLHGSRENLEALREVIDLESLSEYHKIERIKPIPEQIKGYRIYSRKRQTKSNSKLNRLIKRNTLNDEQIKQYKTNWYKQGLEYPFVELISVSTKQRYRIFIKPSEIIDTPTQGIFSQFGLSSTATVPIF